MKKILILQMRPEDETADAEFQAILTKGNIPRDQADRIRVEQQKVKEINLDKYSAIIAGGSPFDISTPKDKKSETQLAVEEFFNNLFKQLIPNDFPFLGACSGNGLLGNYCGVNISNKYQEAIGPIQLTITEEGKKDELLQGFPQHIQALVGHKEACDFLPEGAVLLASSDTCPVQMFRIKENIYATQFHPEADEEQFSIRIDIYKNYGYFDPNDADVLKEKIRDVQVPETNEILKRFVNRYKTF